MRLKCLSASASIRRQIQMALLVRIRGNNSSGGSMERKFYSGAEPQTEHISPEEEAEVLRKCSRIRSSRSRGARLTKCFADGTGRELTG
jgi:hypothetical protein